MLSRELLRKIRTIELSASRLVAEQLAGRYHSIFKGRGMAFSEVREYMPGDEVRSIDWNVSARMSRAHVKLFTEERDRTVMLLVDMSASGLFASHARSKREVAAEMAAMIALAAIVNDDRVGLLLYADEVEHYLAPKKGKRHVLRVIRELLSFEPRTRGTRLGTALQYLGRVTKRRCVAFVLSDFDEPSEEWQRPLQMAARRHEVVPFVLVDPLEEALPDVGILTVRDLESDQLVAFDTGGPNARRYREERKVQREARASAFRRMSVDAAYVRTDGTHVDALLRFFRQRERRLHG